MKELITWLGKDATSSVLLGLEQKGRRARAIIFGENLKEEPYRLQVHGSLVAGSLGGWQNIRFSWGPTH